MPFPRFRRYFWPSLAMVCLGIAAYLWRSNLLLQAQLAQWRSERVTEQVAAYQARAHAAPRTEQIVPTSASPATLPGNTNTNPDAGEKAIVEKLKSEVVVSFGSVEQMGSTLAGFFSTEQARKLRTQAQQLGAADQAMTPEETAEHQRQLAAVIGMLPEVEKFQDQPAEYGRFFKGLFQAGGALNEDQANQVERIMKIRATEGIKQGLNAGNKPTDGAVVWEIKRDAFNEETANQLKEILPAKAQETFPVDGPLMEFLEMDFEAAGISLPAALVK